jgi:phosphohistidine phosphatase
MRLYFLRHGIAEEREPGLQDFGRKLTPEGIEEMHRSAAGMKRLGLKFDAILSSPLIRARETAAIVAETLGQEMREEPLLASGAGLEEFRKAVKDQPDGAHVLLVGHEPDLSETISALIGGGMVRMKKGALACVNAREVRADWGELRWLLNPDHLALGAREESP